MRVKGLTERIIMPAVIMLLLSSPALAAHLHLEKEYQNQWCADHNGITEYVLSDNSRVDCLTDEYAIEFDFANKWGEAVGQSLYYAYQTNRKAGIVLILESEKDTKYLLRLLPLCDEYHIRLWIIRPEDLRKDDYER